jgi:hypothetical protein
MIFHMLPFCLYFVAGVITGFHVYTLVILTVYGAPFNPFEFVSLLGSLCLLVAAYVSLFRPYAAARLALLASLAIWCFYGPAIAKSIRTKLGKQSSEFRAPAVFTSARRRRSPATTTVSVVRAGRFIASSGLGED